MFVGAFDAGAGAGFLGLVEHHSGMGFAGFHSISVCECSVSRLVSIVFGGGNCHYGNFLGNCASRVVVGMYDIKQMFPKKKNFCAFHKNVCFFKLLCIAA